MARVWKIKVSGNPIEVIAIAESVLGLRKVYKQWRDGRLSVQVATQDKVAEGDGWCKFIEDTVEGLQYYYVIGEIADRPDSREWLTFDLALNPIDPDFPSYIQQCQTSETVLVHTLIGQRIEVPITNPAVLTRGSTLAQQSPVTTPDVFYLTACEKHDQFKEAKIHRPANFENIIFD